MVALVFSTSSSTINKLFDAHTLKVAYLLSERIVVLGEIGSMVQINNKKEKYDFKQKIAMLEKATLNDKNDAGYNYVLDVKHSVKQFKASKHPTKEAIVLNAAVEKNFYKYFDECMKNHSIYLKKFGLDEIGALQEENIFFSCCQEMRVQNTTNKEEPDKKLAESVLKLLHPSGNPRDGLINFLPIDFLMIDSERKKENLEEVIVEGDIEDDELVLMSKMELSHIDCLSAMELKALKNQAWLDGEVFRGKMDEFIKINFENEKNLAEKQQFIDDYIDPEVSRLQNSIEDSHLIQCRKKEVKLDAMRFEIYIGEAPVEYYWKFFEKFNIIDEFTLKYAKGLVAKVESTRRMIPFVCVSGFYINFDGMTAMLAKEDSEIESPSLRKFISIDDD